MIVYANFTDSNNTLSGPFIPKGGIYAIFLEYDKVDIQEPAVLYQTTLSGIKFDVIDYDIDYAGVGQTCIVTGNFTNRMATDIFYLKIDFLSSGNIHNVEPLNIQTNSTIKQYNVQSLTYGGYLFSGQEKNEDDLAIMYGYLTNGHEFFP